MKKVLSFLFFFVCAMVMCMTYALAYIDPGALTYIIQIVAGLVIAAGAAIGFYWRRIKRALSRKKNNDDDDYDEEDDEDEEDEE